MVATADIIDEIKQITDERSLLKHPFYQAWQKGELTSKRCADTRASTGTTSSPSRST